MTKGTDYIGVAAGAMIFNAAGKIFLSLRSQNCTNERGHWETPGGSIEFGETQADATRREIREEYGIEIDLVQQLPAADHFIPAEQQHWVATTFLATLPPHQIPRILEPHKCNQIGWFDLDELPHPLSLITQADIQQYRKLKAAGGIAPALPQ